MITEDASTHTVIATTSPLDSKIRAALEKRMPNRGDGEEPSVLIRRPNRAAPKPEPAEPEERRGLSIEQIREKRAELEARTETAKARAREAERTRAEAQAQIAGYAELARLQKENPSEFLKRFGAGSIRDILRATHEADQLTPAQREVRQLKREMQAQAENLNRRLEQEDAAKSERARGEANHRIAGQLKGIFQDVANEAGLSASQLEKVAAKAHRFCLGFYDRNGRAPTMAELDDFGTKLPEFLPFMAKKIASATPKPAAAKPAPRAPRGLPPSREQGEKWSDHVHSVIDRHKRNASKKK